jgi:hypothetical protein
MRLHEPGVHSLPLFYSALFDSGEVLRYRMGWLTNKAL